MKPAIAEMPERREVLWNYYKSELFDNKISLPCEVEDKNSRHAKHLFTIGLPEEVNRDEFVWKASQEFNITMGVHYNAIPTFTAYKNYWSEQELVSNCKNAIEWGKRTVSLSLSAGVDDSDAERVVEATKDLLKNCHKLSNNAKTICFNSLFVEFSTGLL
jgi:dTDP-4-amino-4,6-dideoxygalactose transaminase